MEKKKAAGALMLGLTMAYVVTAVLLLLLAFVLFKMQPDAGKMEIGILAAYVLSCFVGGRLCAGRNEKRKFFWGLLTGILYFLLLYAISGMSDRTVQSGLLQSLTALALCAGGGMLGGMLSK